MVTGGAPSGIAKRQRLAQRRRALGLTQETLAAMLGVKRSTVIRWERGESEPVSWIRPKLAKALRVSEDRLGELLDSRGGASPGAGQNGPVSTVPRQLLAAVPDFTGRVAELQTLTGILDEAAAGPPGTVVISAIGGTAGVGKTALALHWAHQVAHRFPDGQLHVNLRGFDPSGTPATPAVAIREFLDALGVPPERVAPTLDAQVALYRSVLAGKRMLIVLDNARDEQQVRPLLPASPGSLILVTSRNRLGGLAATDAARLVSLDVLTHDEAVQLLMARLGDSRAAGEWEAIDEIAGLCAHLPLALGVAAARAVARPRFPLAALAVELRVAVDRLDTLDADDPAASVRAVFSWSYRQLSHKSARMFRLLGLHPGPDITVAAAASLAATDEPAARRLLRELTRDHLLAEHVPGRYAFHDLLRAYAAEQARICDDERERTAVIGRVLDHYLHTAHDAALLVESSRIPVVPPSSRFGVTPERLADIQQAMAWFQAEQQVLVAAINLAAGAGFDIHAWQIPWTMGDFLDRRADWEKKLAIERIAMEAATRVGDTVAQIESSRLLAGAYSRLGHHDQARAHLWECLELYQRAGNPHGEAKTHLFLGGVAVRQGRPADALAHSEQALRLYQAIGEKPGEATMLNNIGHVHALLGDYRQSRAFCQRALALSAEIGRPSTEAYACSTLGYAEHHLGNLAEAADCYRRALSLSRELRDRRLEADVLTQLGDTRQAAGELAQAREAWRQALAVQEELANPDADKLRAKLADTGQ
jgi:tetratricopeptide (TPR) repeat protein/transcriptional regulator with XRE-family HTH domain